MIYKSKQGICFLISVCGIFLMSVAIFLFYPGSYLTLNKGNSMLQLFASLLFWVGLLAGAVLQTISLVLRRKAAPKFRKELAKEQEECSKKQRLYRAAFKNKIALGMAIGFLIGVVGMVCSLIHSMDSSYHTFFFMALTVFGLFEYLAFNSINFVYAMSKE